MIRAQLRRTEEERVIPAEKRDAYMAALEDASVRQDIKPFAVFLAQMVREGLDGKTVPGLRSSN